MSHDPETSRWKRREIAKASAVGLVILSIIGWALSYLPWEESPLSGIMFVIILLVSLCFVIVYILPLLKTPCEKEGQIYLSLYHKNLVLLRWGQNFM